MLEQIPLILNALGLSIPIVSFIWVIRYTKKLRSINGLFGLVIISYALWHFILLTQEQITPFHETLTNLFVIVTSIVNAYCSTIDYFTIGINRRKKQIKNYRFPYDRRKNKSYLLFDLDK